MRQCFSILTASASGVTPAVTPPKIMRGAEEPIMSESEATENAGEFERSDGTSPQRSQPVTERERQVAALIAEGLSNREIGHHLGIVENTVKRHVSNLLLKLDATNRAQIAVIATQRGWTRR
jgi:DNA-binding NarL/FixJ family response regulator